MVSLDVFRRHNVLQRLRRRPVAARMLRAFDIPVPIRVPGVAGRLHGRAVQHAAYYLTSKGPEPEIAACVQALLRATPVDLFVDVGANIGYYSFLVATGSPDASCILIEPDPGNVSLLRSTLRRHPARTRMSLVVGAASRESGRMILHRDLVTGHQGGLLAADGLVASATVDVITLDELLFAHRGKRLFIKIDVEGAEEDVLAGANAVLQQGRPLILIECFHSHDAPGSAVVTLEENYGYVCFEASDGLPVYRADTTNYVAIPRERQVELLDSLRA